MEAGFTLCFATLLWTLNWRETRYFAFLNSTQHEALRVDLGKIKDLKIDLGQSRATKVKIRSPQRGFG
jgi:hypothetical protein